MEDSQKIKAYEFAKIAMAGRKRYSGETFEEHRMKTAKILEGFGVGDNVTLSAAILHHVIADGAASMNDIEKEFGLEIAGILKTLESLRVLKLGNVSNKEFVEGLRRMFLVLSRDMRVVLVKLADLLDNLTTLQFVPVEKQKRVAEETLEIFAPLAERLGMGEMKGRMQDLAFPYLYPQEFDRVKKLLKKSTSELEKDLAKVRLVLKKEFDRDGVEYQISSRAKHLYSLYMKLKRPEIDFDISKVNDLIAFRVITNSLEDCYRVLGIVHKLWRPIPDEFADFIANPKQNGYQSIHTKVLGPGGKPFEIQIRTKKMHEAAEYGVAAHWSYAEAKSKGASDTALEHGVRVGSKLDWVQRLAKWQEEVVDNEEFLKSIKTDFFGERIYVFTPKGDVKDLPIGATPVDFAYSVHSGLGDLATGARVNGKLVSLDTKLSNTDVCEILVSKHTKKPNRDWLKFVVTGWPRKKLSERIYDMKISLAVFDVEGTISYFDGVPRSILSAVGLMHDNQIYTTVVTGTGYERLRMILGDYFDTLISDDVLVGVENGARLVGKDGTTKFKRPLLEKEIIKTLELIRLHRVPFCVYYRDFPLKPILLVFDRSKKEEYESKYSFFNIIDTIELDVVGKLKQDEVCQLIFPFSETSFSCGLNSLLNEGFVHILPMKVDKGPATMTILRAFKVPMDQVLVAGNYQNDIAMLELPVGLKYYVGILSDKTKHITNLRYVKDVDSFGLELVRHFSK